MELERKYLSVKAEDISDTGEFFGYASIYDNEDLGGDIIVKGAFTETLEKNQGEVPMLWQHDMKIPIGKFLLQDDVKGLMAFGKINLGTEKGREAHALLKSGDIKGLSIGYRVKDYEFDKEGWTRTLKQVDLFEVSIVTFPMNTEANVELSTVKSANMNSEEEAQKLQEYDALVEINSRLDEIILEDNIRNFKLN